MALDKRKIAIVAATVVLAAATGHVVQNGTRLLPSGGDAGGPEVTAAAAMAPMPRPGARALAISDAPPALPADPAPAGHAAFPALAGLDGVVPVSAPVLIAAAYSPESDSAPARALAKPLAAPTAATADCTVQLSVSAAPAAMIALNLSAPCQPDARVLLRHAGLAVTGRTDAGGALRLEVPALADPAEVTAIVAGGAPVSAETAIPDLAAYERIALQWQGEDSFALNALEFGADEGQPGHVSAANPRSPALSARIGAGFLTALGDGSVPWPLLAEVYSFPTGETTRAGTVRLFLDAGVTEATCGREMLAETLELRAGAPLRRTELALAMPGCEDAGAYLVLKNLIPDLKIAAN